MAVQKILNNRNNFNRSLRKVAKEKLKTQSVFFTEKVINVNSKNTSDNKKQY